MPGEAMKHLKTLEQENSRLKTTRGRMRPASRLKAGSAMNCWTANCSSARGPMDAMKVKSTISKRDLWHLPFVPLRSHEITRGYTEPSSTSHVTLNFLGKLP